MKKEININGYDDLKVMEKVYKDAVDEILDKLNSETNLDKYDVKIIIGDNVFVLEPCATTYNALGFMIDFIEAEIGN